MATSAWRGSSLGTADGSVACRVYRHRSRSSIDHVHHFPIVAASLRIALALVPLRVSTVQGLLPQGYQG